MTFIESATVEYPGYVELHIRSITCAPDSPSDCLSCAVICSEGVEVYDSVNGMNCGDQPVGFDSFSICGRGCDFPLNPEIASETSLNTGGNCWIDVIELTSGHRIVVNEEVVSVHAPSGETIEDDTFESPIAWGSF